MGDRWMTCSACRTDIDFGATHYVCSVSTCNRSRTRLVFCSVPCWDSHVATLRHRDAWAVEAEAPSQVQWEAEQRAEAAAPAPAAPRPAPTPRPAPAVVRAPAPAPPSPSPPSGPPAPVRLTPADESDVLIVVSKMKKYIKERSGMNCSDAVAEGLSHHVRAICDLAIRNAGADGRKTVLDRDVPPVRRG
jgi:hypothetical protein